MNKSLAVLILALLLFKGVDRVSLTDEDYEMADKLFTLGAEAFLKYLDNFKGAAEVVVEKNKISKTGTDLQDLWISVKEMIKKISAEEGVKGHDHFIVALHIFHRLGMLYRDGLFRVLYAFPGNGWTKREFGMYKGIFKNETVVDLWKYVESHYLPGAPPIYSDSLGFLAYLLSKLGAQPQVAKILKVAVEVGKTDINQLFDEVQMAVQLVREKAMEISTLERQNEKDEFLITLRTASGVLAFYWDKLLEYTESQPFHNKYLAAVRRWKELRVLKDTGKYHVITSPETGLQTWTWADERFSDLFDNAALEYDRWGNGIFGDERFNQSNWAIMKMATVYPLPIFERVSENGLGMPEVNDFFIDTENTLTELLGEDILFNLKAVIDEIWNIISNEIFHVSINKKNQMTSNVEYEDPLRHLRKIKATCFAIWDRVLSEINRQINIIEHEELARRWNEVKNIFIKELTDSGELTQEKLDEAQKTFNSVTQMFFDKCVKKIDGLEERISASTEILGKVMLMTFFATDSVLVNLPFLLSD
ncbi:uncharacterized protein [Sinocyclocheilus grahami]|uniref:Uncharacterized LOC107599518 n=1 Tax=Sinocyclocheilus grahami TaxID=75366 RepID=A0A672PF11_SINGR|nr:PREDICTED: uncharacterized protein LOC107599518 [Sinocyclocheilus grahami]XP_016146624.1 PREDICTED: uncharacterized protein LOC107599518 [Sinocyclocheilus grahami]XP_016146625.1 PREDICTED: uncharacterized protein LOC107599518 [Sinocyclocheilus grahami]